MSPWTIVREILLAVGMILLLILSLWGVTGRMPPLVVVESPSMSHDSSGEIGVIDAGDLILVHSTSISEIVTFAEATQNGNERFGHSSHGMAGDVVIYEKNGQAGTPIIHRAIMRVIAHDTISPTDRNANNPCINTEGSWDPSSLDSDGELGTCVLTWDALGTTQVDVPTITWTFDGNETGLYECKRGVSFDHGNIGLKNNLTIEEWNPSHSGLLTLGDNNYCSVDQGNDAVRGSTGLHDSEGRLVETVRSDWVDGRAGAEIPWLGTIKLMLSGNEPGTKHITPDTWQSLWISIAALFAIPFIIEPVIVRILRGAPEIKEADIEMCLSHVGEEG